MNVKIKQFDVSMEIKNKGIEIDVSNPKNRHLGDLYVTKSGLIWCKGKKDKKNGEKISWTDFISRIEKNN